MGTTYGLPKKRDEVLEVLKEAFIERNLDEQEYERRMSDAIDAKSLEELETLLFDFPYEIRSKIFVGSALQRKEETRPFTPNSAPRSVSYEPGAAASRAILSGMKQVPGHIGHQQVKFVTILGDQRVDFRIAHVDSDTIFIKVDNILGKTVIDLRNREFYGREVVLELSGGLGEVQVLIPRGTRVDKSVQLILGSTKFLDRGRTWFNRLIGKQEAPQEDITFLLRITGIYWLGDIKLIS